MISCWSSLINFIGENEKETSGKTVELEKIIYDAINKGISFAQREWSAS